ncbi:hypothetical protein [Azospirillum argentinense]
MPTFNYPGRPISERELTAPTLVAMAQRPNGFIRTSELISELTNAFNPTGHDAEIAMGRSDTYFSQKVRNMVSHRNNSTSFIKNGYAVYSKELKGFRITDKGRSHIMSI